MTGARSIAAAQTMPIRGDVDANIDHHIELGHAAADRQAQVLVFPELSLTGYELDLAPELAFSERDPRLAPLVTLASATRMTLVVGAPVRMASRLHIGAFIIGPGGAVDVYTKQRLGAFPASASPDGVVPPAEATVFRHGDRNPLIHVGDNTAVVAICADLNAPSHPEEAAERGATIYLASTFIIPPDLEQDAARLRAYARRHDMVVAAANYGGPSGGLPAAGGSAVWSGRGELLAQLPEAGAGVVVAAERMNGWHPEIFLLGAH